MTDIDKDRIVNEGVADSRNRRVRWPLVVVILLGLALAAGGAYELTTRLGDTENERDVAETAVGMTDPVIAELVAACEDGRADQLPPGLTCPEVREAQDAVEDVGEIQEPELQETEIQDDEIQQPEIDNPDPDDPDRPNDPDPDDPENQDDEQQEPEVDDSEPDDPEVQDEEFDDPENQEPEIQEDENQEPEIQEQELQEPQDPAQTMTFHEMPGPGATTTCTLIGGGDPRNPEYDCSSDTGEGGGSSLLSWLAMLAYLGAGRKTDGDPRVGLTR